MCHFYEKEMMPKFEIILRATQKDNAMFDAYQKMYWYLTSLAKLDNKIYFQTVLNVVRSMFELSLDIICLNRDDTNVETEKYHNHRPIAKYKMGKKVLKYKDEHPDADIGEYMNDFFVENMRIFVKEMEDKGKIEKIKSKYWPDRKGLPLHWSGKSFEKLHMI